MRDRVHVEDERRQVRAFPELWHDEREQPPLPDVSSDAPDSTPPPARASVPNERAAGDEIATAEPPGDTEPGAEQRPLDDDSQGALFAPESEVRAELGRALAEGRFEDVLALHEQIAATDLGPRDDAQDERLRRLAACTWEPEVVTSLLSTWEELERERPEPGLHGRRTPAEERGFFRRLAGVAPLEEIARRHRRCIAALANAALRHDGAPFRARGIVRDALLAGLRIDVHVLAFDEPATRELLAEDGPPERIACLGELRRTWPPSPPSADDLAAVERWCDLDPPDDEAERMRRAWTSLRIARSPSVSARAREAARRLLRSLDAELHAELMGE